MDGPGKSARRRQVAAALGLALSAAAAAYAGTPDTTDERCDEPEARQFDFWLGDWSIRQRILAADGSWLELPAHTRVESALGGCALLERWEGEVELFWEGMKRPARRHGLSVRAWDPASGRWRIWWIDSASRGFGPVASGVFTRGRGEFFAERTAPDGGRRWSRITFARAGERVVEWELAVSGSRDGPWRAIWTMEMTRTGAPPPRDRGPEPAAPEPAAPGP